jgi:hypothetical protein
MITNTCKLNWNGNGEFDILAQLGIKPTDKNSVDLQVLNDEHFDSLLSEVMTISANNKNTFFTVNFKSFGHTYSELYNTIDIQVTYYKGIEIKYSRFKHYESNDQFFKVNSSDLS